MGYWGILKTTSKSHQNPSFVEHIKSCKTLRNPLEPSTSSWVVFETLGNPLKPHDNPCKARTRLEPVKTVKTLLLQHVATLKICFYHLSEALWNLSECYQHNRWGSIFCLLQQVDTKSWIQRGLCLYLPPETKTGAPSVVVNPPLKRTTRPTRISIMGQMPCKPWFALPKTLQASYAVAGSIPILVFH